MLNRFKIGTRIGAGFAICLTLVAVFGTIAYETTNSLVANSREERKAHQIVRTLNELVTDLLNAETGQRGYIITGQPRYLEPYDKAIASIDRNYELLRSLTKDSPTRQNQLEILKPLIDERLDRLQEGIRLRDRGGIQAGVDFILGGQGQRVMLRIRTLTAEMETEEKKLLEQRSQQSELAAARTLETIVFGIPASFIFLSLVGLWLSRNISRPLQELSTTAEQIASGDLLAQLPDSNSRDETGILTRTFKQMVDSLRATIQTNEEQRWLTSNLAELSQLIQGQRDLEQVAHLALTRVVSVVGAQQGVFYYLGSDTEAPLLRLLSAYAYQERKHLAHQFRLGEGLVGQCALEKQRILLAQVPGDYIQITSGLGEAPPLNIVVVPILFETQVQGVLELASFQRFTELQLTFLDEASNSIGVMLNAIAAYIQTQELLDQSQALTQELRHQQEELLQSNQLLEERTQSLQESELVLQQQQEELQQSNEELQQLNEELEEKAELLEAQKQQVERKNQEIEQARQGLEEQAQQLALSSKYKSEFLANMSHELRTPLNSLLILAELLSNNSEGNLTEKQAEYSRTIYAAGVDLLSLINDILDLAKIESGTMAINLQSVSLSALRTDLERTFRQVAFSKGLSLAIELDEDLPTNISTDPKRLQQILKNLLSNALKFTEQGSVTVHVRNAEANQVAFVVSDTGIGIPAEKQQVIFEAFQQADGTTSRKYGGTGLGLSISLELARLLGGTIELVSQVEQGSTFTLYLPKTYKPATNPDTHSSQRATNTRSPVQVVDNLRVRPSTAPVSETIPTRSLLPLPKGMEDDRDALQPNSPTQTEERVLLIIEDDLNFARIVLEMARRQGFKGLVALDGQTGLNLAKQFLPSAITLDLHLPDVAGWTVLEQLKRDPETRHIPVHVLTVEDRQPREFQMGAIAHIQKPVSPEVLTQTLAEIKRFVERQVRHLMVIEDDPIQAHSIIELIGGEDVESTTVETGVAALEILKSQLFDCIVLDLGLPDMSGFDLIEAIKREPNLVEVPIIVYTGKELTEAEETQLRRLAETIIIKDVRSPERLLAETALFLHRVQANLPPAKRQLLEKLYQSDPTLLGKKVLIVDDDVRNIFALTSFLEQYQVEVLFAENGKAGIQMLEAHPDIAAVLMDVMMPEMDGYETTKAIRQQEQFRTLPIITLTAKAMQGDREKCIEAGASDYITKPVDTEQLLSLLRLWLYP